MISGRILDLILTYRLYENIKNALEIVYTFWRNKDFKKYGVNSKFGFGIQLVGVSMIEIGNNVWFGEKTSIMGGIKIVECYYRCQ